MAEKQYLIKANTAWTFAFMFCNEKYWDDPIEADSAKQLVKKEEEMAATGGNEILDEVSNQASSSKLYPSNQELPSAHKTAAN